MPKALRTIAVDLTPVLPGGENGGAKVFALELLRGLAMLRPQTQFLLVTQKSTHEELAVLDAPNVHRVLWADVEMADMLNERRFLARVLRRLFRLSWRMRGASPELIADKLLERHFVRGLSALDVDLLFCPFTRSIGFTAKIPAVCTIHDLQYKSYPAFFDPEDRLQREKDFLAACNNANKLVADSDYTRGSVIKHGQVDVAHVSTVYLRLAKRLQQIDPTADTLSQWALTPQNYLLYPANFWLHKNHEMLLMAFAIACKRGLAAGIPLVCTGTGARQQEIVSAANSMGLADRIRFLGHVPLPQLATLMAQCRGVIFPSLYEGFGLPILEAMTLGVPVACSDVTALPEVAGAAALLFDPREPTQIAQAMLSLVTDGPLRAQLIQKGQERAREFSNTQRMAEEYWAVFQAAWREHKRSRQRRPCTISVNLAAQK